MFVDAIGWIGAVLVLIAYGMISFRKVEGNSLIYQLLNVFGSIFLIVNTYYYGAIPSTLVNLVWALIALFAIGAIIRRFGKQAGVEGPRNN